MIFIALITSQVSKFNDKWAMYVFQLRKQTNLRTKYNAKMLNKYGMFVILHERNFQGEANKKKLNANDTQQKIGLNSVYLSLTIV